MNPKWEYHVLKIPTYFGLFSGTDFDAEKLSEQLNGFGAEG